MDLAARRAQARQILRRVFWAWCAAVCAAGTVGGIIGTVTRENDQT